MQTNSTKNLENLEVNQKEFYEVIGSNGQIRLTRNRIIISRKGAMGFISQGLKGDKEIPISRITAIQFKHNDALTKGYLQFYIQGGLESRGGVFAATTDENTVMFTDLQEPSFKELKRYIDSVMDNEPINFDTLNFVEINATYQQNKEKIIETKQKMIESNAQSNKVLANKVFKPLLAIVIVSSIIMSISPEESASKILFGLAFIISSTCLMFSLPYIDYKKLSTELDELTFYLKSILKK
jgi:hypothetical protein